MFHSHVLAFRPKLALCLGLTAPCETNNVEGLMFSVQGTFFLVRKIQSSRGFAFAPFFPGFALFLRNFVPLVNRSRWGVAFQIIYRFLAVVRDEIEFAIRAFGKVLFKGTFKLLK